MKHFKFTVGGKPLDRKIQLVSNCTHDRIGSLFASWAKVATEVNSNAFIHFCKENKAENELFFNHRKFKKK